MPARNFVVFALPVTIVVLFALRRRLRSRASLDSLEWRSDVIGRDDLAG